MEYELADTDAFANFSSLVNSLGTEFLRSSASRSTRTLFKTKTKNGLVRSIMEWQYRRLACNNAMLCRRPSGFWE